MLLGVVWHLSPVCLCGKRTCWQSGGRFHATSRSRTMTQQTQIRNGTNATQFNHAPPSSTESNPSVSRDNAPVPTHPSAPRNMENPMTNETGPNPKRAKDRGPLTERGYTPRRHDHDRRNSTTQELTRTIDDLLDSLFGDVNHDVEALRCTGLIPRFA